MEPITSLGVGSGLDLATLLDQLVAAERSSTSGRLDSREIDARGKLSSLGIVKSTLERYREARDRLFD